MSHAFYTAAQQLEERLLSVAMPECEREEGRLYVAGLIRWQLERALVSSDPGYPRFTRCMDEVTKWGAENPDNVYRSATIDGEAEYLIRGERGSCADICFEVLPGLPGDDGTAAVGMSFLDLDDLSVDADGTYTIQVGGTRGRGNYLASGPGATEVFVRHTVGDWDEDVGALTIERVGPPRAPRRVDDLLNLGARRLTAGAGFMEDFATRWRETSPVNALSDPSGANRAGYFPGQRNATGQFELLDDQALLVTFELVRCRYMSLAVSHHRWWVSFDYRNRHSSLNSAQAHVSADGRIRMVLSATDPGVPNWIDTVGHQRGFLFLRYQGVTGPDPSAPHVTLLSVAQVRDALGADEPTISPEARDDRIERRRLALDHRFRP